MDMQAETDQPEKPEVAEAKTPSGSSRFLGSFLGVRDGAPAFERYGGVLLLILLIVIFSFASSQFFTSQNFIGIAGNQAVQGLLSIGLLFPLACGVFDVSVNGTMTLSVVAVTWLFQITNGNMPIWLAIIIVLLAAVVAGLINAGLIVKLGIDPFIATIGTSSLFEGISQIMGNGETITMHIPNGFIALGQDKIASIPLVVIIVLVIAVIAWYILSQTPGGRLIYATGAAPDAARLSGIRTNRVLACAYVASALGAAGAGILFAAQQGAGAPSVGQGFLLPAYATVFLGGTILKPGRFNVWGLIIAILIIAVGINGLELVGGPFWIQDLFEAVALIGAVALSTVRSRRR
jgi:ribose transport system permease protein